MPAPRAGRRERAVRRGETHDHLIGLAYEAALEPERWQAVIDALRSNIGANSGLLRLFDDNCTELDFNLTVGFDPVYQEIYRQRFVHDDPIRDGVARLQPGRLVREEAIVPFETLRRTQFYDEYMRPQGKRYILGGTLLREADVLAILGLQRDEGAAPFTSSQERSLNHLAGHLQRALRLHLRCANLRATVRTLSSLLDAIPTAVFAIDQWGCVRLANEAADRLVEAGDTFYIASGKLRARNPRCDRMLRQEIAACSGEGARPTRRPGDLASIPAPPSREDPTGVLVAPWTDPVENDVGSARRVRALVLIGNDRGTRTTLTNLVADMLELKPSEARLVLALAECGTLEAAAEYAGIRYTTAREYLKSIFHKTGCHRQAELVRKVFRTPVAQFAEFDHRSRD